MDAQFRYALLLLPLLWLLGGCNQQEHGAIEVHWDRDSCERCRMVLSDRQSSAQVRYRDERQRSRVMLFDDFGCAVVWLEDKPWKDALSTEFWVNASGSGEWLDAKKAYYLGGGQTSMAYGLLAFAKEQPASMAYEAARLQVLAIEARDNLHTPATPRTPIPSVNPVPGE
ncbi:MAG: hypothetical protein HQL49_01670 [Gammaproteobacteria bacterium]|nr:hypothetical protein [Gammaproteobacteria bacterium]